MGPSSSPWTTPQYIGPAQPWPRQHLPTSCPSHFLPIPLFSCLGSLHSCPHEPLVQSCARPHRALFLRLPLRSPQHVLVPGDPPQTPRAPCDRVQPLQTEAVPSTHAANDPCKTELINSKQS